MDDQDTSPKARAFAITACAAVVAFVLLKFWMESANASWSSDAWLTNTYEVIAASGLIAAVLLPIAILVAAAKMKAGPAT